MQTLLGSLYAGMAFSNAPCAALHALAYPIGKEECRRCLVVYTRAWPFPTCLVQIAMPWLTLSVSAHADASCSLFPGMAFSNAPCAAVYALAYPIGKCIFRRCWVVSKRAWPSPRHLVCPCPLLGSFYAGMAFSNFPCAAVLCPCPDFPHR
jgi:hypothetical protein